MNNNYSLLLQVRNYSLLLQVRNRRNRHLFLFVQYFCASETTLVRGVKSKEKHSGKLFTLPKIFLRIYLPSCHKQIRILSHNPHTYRKLDLLAYVGLKNENSKPTQQAKKSISMQLGIARHRV